MSDRELLEKAAKAAGMSVIIPASHQRGLWIEGLEDEWNPLTDDGDALRLAVKLEISLEFAAKATWVKLRDEDGTLTLGNIPYNNDPYAATRRAIVLAAAEKYQEQQEKNNGN